MYIIYVEKYVLEIWDIISISGDWDINDVCYRIKFNKVYKMMLMCILIYVWYFWLSGKFFSIMKLNESYGI